MMQIIVPIGYLLAGGLTFLAASARRSKPDVALFIEIGAVGFFLASSILAISNRLVLF